MNHALCPQGYGGAGDDEDFVRALTNSYSDCYDISESWPQKNLDRHPLMQVFSYHNIHISSNWNIYLCLHLLLQSITKIYWYNLSHQSIAYRYNLLLALQSIITLIYQNQFRHLVDSTFSWTACTRWRRSCATSTRPTWDSRSSMDLTQVEPVLIWLQII